MSPSYPVSKERAREVAATTLRAWRDGQERHLGHGHTWFGPKIRFPGSDAEEVVEQALVSLGRDLVEGRLDGLAAHDLQARATARAHDRAVDELRQRARRPKMESLDALAEREHASADGIPDGRVPEALTSEGVDIEVIEADTTREVMLSLPQADRRLLSDVAVGLDDAELARRLGISKNTIRKRKERARKRAVAMRAHVERSTS